MKAIQQSALSGLDGIAVADVPAPAIGDRHVLIDVEAAGVNFADILMTTGAYQATPAPPFTLGLELAGVVRAVSPDVDGVFVGDRVMAFVDHGAFAEQVSVPDARCMVMPTEMEFEQGAAFPIAYGTAHLALTHRGRLREGAVLLVHGAAGGVGLAAVQVGKALGATVIATAGGSEKLEIALAAGADHGIDTRTENIKDRVRALTGGADVVFDPVGGETFLQSMRCVNPLARMLVIGFAGGDVQKIPANLALVKNTDIFGVYWGAYAALDPTVLRQSADDLGQMFADGLLKPHISHTLPLDRARDGLQLLKDRAAMGKVVLKVR